MLSYIFSLRGDPAANITHISHTPHITYILIHTHTPHITTYPILHPHILHTSTYSIHTLHTSHLHILHTSHLHILHTSHPHTPHITSPHSMHTSHPHTAYLIQTATTDGTKVTFALALPANLPVGAYRLELEVSPEHSRTRHTFRLPQELVVLFNPWCPGECVCEVWSGGSNVTVCVCMCVCACVCVCGE